jgi:outer membrane cobalamin receptor
VRPSTLRDSPAVITVITREEIRDMGARDLIDVLSQVPGFWFGVDVSGVVGLGFRGNWGHEGKILLLIDGQEMNERLYSTLQLGHHYPVEHIERIEIIRGPGSAIYGGFAELAVINVITTSTPPGGEGVVRASVTYGQTAEDFGHRRVSACATDEVRAVSGLELSFCGALGQGRRGDGTYGDFYGSSYELADNARLDPAFLNLGVRFRDTRLRLIFDRYRTTARDGFDEAKPTADDTTFTSFYAELSHELRPADRVQVTPRLSWKHETPWRTPNIAATDFYDKTSQRLLGGVTAAWQPRDGLDLLLGLEAFLDHAELNDANIVGGQTTFGAENSISYTNLAAFAQVLWANRIVNVAAGARVENHSSFGASFVPRVALTRVFGRFHAKALFSTAFRAPGIENINLAAGELEPERTRVFEVELGAEVGAHAFVAVNAFDIAVDDPIVYFYDAVTMAEGYANFPKMGSRGVELEARVKHARGWLNASWSFYDLAGKNEVDLYAVAADDSVALALPAHKVAAAGSLKIWRGLSLSPSVVVTSARHGFLTGDGMGTGTQGEIGAQVDLSVFAAYALPQGLRFAIGARNLLDADNRFLQPYDGGHAPLPALGPEILATVSYERPL